MEPTPRELGWALAGALIVGVGAGTATLAAFAPTLPGGPDNFGTRTVVIAVGYAIFFAGYHVSQVGTYREPETPLIDAFLPIPARTGRTSGTVTPFIIVRGLFIILGVLGLGAGMRLFALTVESWDPLVGVLAGAVSIGGYICGHIGINWVLL